MVTRSTYRTYFYRSQDAATATRLRARLFASPGLSFNCYRMSLSQDSDPMLPGPSYNTEALEVANGPPSTAVDILPQPRNMIMGSAIIAWGSFIRTESISTKAV